MSTQPLQPKTWIQQQREQFTDGLGEVISRHQKASWAIKLMYETKIAAQQANIKAALGEEERVQLQGEAVGQPTRSETLKTELDNIVKEYDNALKKHEDSIYPNLERLGLTKKPQQPEAV